MKLTIKQERFAQNLFLGMNQSRAYVEAGYVCKSRGTLRSAACRLATNVNVQRRLKELIEKAASDKVMTVIERKERLSEIARTTLADFVEFGADGSVISIDRESQHTAAIQEIHSDAEYNKDSANAPQYTQPLSYTTL